MLTPTYPHLTPTLKTKCGNGPFTPLTPTPTPTFLWGVGWWGGKP